MSRLLFVLILAAAAPALAKPWNGIYPGASSVIDVIGKFGEPTKRLSAGGKDVLVYSGTAAIKGTVQAQFKCTPDTHVVERIDVYPAPVIDLPAIEKSYGKACDPKDAHPPCYYRKETPTKHPYLVYLELGLAVFFKDDGQTVRSFAFLPSSTEG